MVLGMGFGVVEKWGCSTPREMQDTGRQTVCSDFLGDRLIAVIGTAMHIMGRDATLSGMGTE